MFKYPLKETVNIIQVYIFSVDTLITLISNLLSLCLQTIMYDFILLMGDYEHIKITMIIFMYRL